MPIIHVMGDGAAPVLDVSALLDQTCVRVCEARVMRNAGRGIDPDLARALAEGTYVVDARAVADAILLRRRGATERSGTGECSRRPERPRRRRA